MLYSLKRRLKIHQMHENEQLIDSVADAVQGAESGLLYAGLHQILSIPSWTWLILCSGYVLTPLEQLQRLPNQPSLMTSQPLPTSQILINTTWYSTWCMVRGQYAKTNEHIQVKEALWIWEYTITRGYTVSYLFFNNTYCKQLKKIAPDIGFPF